MFRKAETPTFLPILSLGPGVLQVSLLCEHTDISGILLWELVVQCSLGTNTHSRDVIMKQKGRQTPFSYQLLRASSIC